MTFADDTRRKARWLFAATLVLFVASAFRMFALEDVPPGLAQDEVLDADIAQFIRGGEHALFFRHGYGHEPLYHYWAAPFAPLLGDNYLSIRLPSVYLGLLLVALVMRWAKRDYGATAALVAGAGLSVSWWPVIFSRIGIRPILEPVLLALAVWNWPLRAVAITRRGLWAASMTGFWFGLSIYAYTAARIILLLPLLFLLVTATRYAWTRRERSGGKAKRNTLRVQVGYAVVVLLVGGAVYLPLALTLRANPELQQRLEQLEGPLESLRGGDPRPVAQMTAATLGFLSFTGDPRWTYGIRDRPLFDPLTAVFAYAGLLVVLWHWRRPPYLVLSLWLVVALLPSALSPDAPSTVRLIGALPVVYLLPGIALEAVARRYRTSPDRQTDERRLVAGLFAAFLVLGGINGYRTIRDGFVRWPGELETRLRYQSVLLDMGRHWSASGAIAPVVVDVFYEPIDADSLRRTIGADPGARWVQSGASVSGAMVWPGGEGSTVYVPEYAPLEAALMEQAGLVFEPMFRGSGAPSFAVYSLPDPPEYVAGGVGRTFSTPDGALAVAFAGGSRPAVDQGDLSFGSWWRIAAPLPADTAIFVHLLDESGALVVQYDGLDAAATTLREGDVVLQRHSLALPDNLPAGSYTLNLGLYRRGDGRRFVSVDGDDAVEFALCEKAVTGSSALTCRLTEPE